MNFLCSDIQHPTLKLGAIRPVRAMPSIAHWLKASFHGAFARLKGPQGSNEVPFGAVGVTRGGLRPLDGRRAGLPFVEDTAAFLVSVRP
jgi:hypothetical protein